MRGSDLLVLVMKKSFEHTTSLQLYKYLQYFSCSITVTSQEITTYRIRKFVSPAKVRLLIWEMELKFRFLGTEKKRNREIVTASLGYTLRCIYFST